jgi:hypothetical protein
LKAKQTSTALITALDSMNVPELSNLLFDGKGEIELNRRLSISLENQGHNSRVEVSVPSAKGPRTHTDVVLFDDEKHDVIACIECKSCITPDVYQRRTLNNNFTRLFEDVQKYATHNYSPLYIVMWTIHWDEMDVSTTREIDQFKYFSNHRSMHLQGFDLSEIKKNLISNFETAGLGDVIHQCNIGSGDVCRGSRASVIATLSCAS